MLVKEFETKEVVLVAHEHPWQFGEDVEVIGTDEVPYDFTVVAARFDAVPSDPEEEFPEVTHFHAAFHLPFATRDAFTLAWTNAPSSLSEHPVVAPVLKPNRRLMARVAANRSGARVKVKLRCVQYREEEQEPSSALGCDVAEKVRDLEKRCALLEKHYAPAEHNPASPRFLELERRVAGLELRLLNFQQGWHEIEELLVGLKESVDEAVLNEETADDAMAQVTAAKEELSDMQCVLLEELGLEDEAETAEELAQRAVRKIRQLRSELNAMVVGKRADPVPMVRVTDALHIAGRQLCPRCKTQWRLMLCLFCAHNFPSNTECDACSGEFWVEGEPIPTPFELKEDLKR